jgi:hypothetical protein
MASNDVVFTTVGAAAGTVTNMVEAGVTVSSLSITDSTAT